LALQNADKGLEAQIQDIITLNTQQTGQISGLTTELTAVKGNVTSNTTQITSLATTVGEHTTQIGDIQASIQGLAIKSVSASEKVLAADENGVLSTTLGLDSYKKEDGKTFIKLTGIEGAIISEFDASDFVKDGMISSVVYDADTKIMTINWNTDAGLDAVEIPMSGLVDTYTADNKGLKVENNQFSVKLNSSDKNKLTVSENGLLVDISSDIADLESTMDSKIASAFEWEDIQ
jgi:hypothetical protein